MLFLRSGDGVQMSCLLASRCHSGFQSSYWLSDFMLVSCWIQNWQMLQGDYKVHQASSYARGHATKSV